MEEEEIDNMISLDEAIEMLKTDVEIWAKDAILYYKEHSPRYTQLRWRNAFRENTVP